MAFLRRASTTSAQARLDLNQSMVNMHKEINNIRQPLIVEPRPFTVDSLVLESTKFEIKADHYIKNFVAGHFYEHEWNEVKANLSTLIITLKFYEPYMKARAKKLLKPEMADQYTASENCVKIN